jgi:hypothetical protein
MDRRRIVRDIHGFLLGVTLFSPPEKNIFQGLSIAARAPLDSQFLV